MNILITGARGFVGKNLTENLLNIQAGKNRTRKIRIDRIDTYDLDSGEAFLDEACKKADFVFHLAGVNRPKDPAAFMEGNYGLTECLLQKLSQYNNPAPVMFASSIQASLLGRYADSAYGKSKLAGEKLLFSYARDTGAKVLVYRFPNLYGKWCRPQYNSAVATFCHAVAHGLDYTVNDRSTRLELLYIDDLLEEMYDALEGQEHRCEYEGLHPEPKDGGTYCYVPCTCEASLGEITDLLQTFADMPQTKQIPRIPEGSFAAKLYSTYLSYLPKERAAYGLAMNRDERGVFTELIRTDGCGQVSVNIARPGNVRGQHWHNSKWEIFIVVSGHGLIQQRKIGLDKNGKPYPVLEYEVSGENMQAVQMLPGYTHKIRNLSQTQDLVTVMWANEPFDPQRPDTFFEEVAGNTQMPPGETKIGGKQSHAVTEISK